MNRKFGLEARVGLFALVIIALAVYASFRMEGWSPRGNRGYTLYTSFDNAQGLHDETSIRIAGVEVGKVQTIELVEGKEARVKMRIYPEIVLEEGVVARIRSKGLLGDKFIELVPPEEYGRNLEDGEDIGRGEVPPDFEDMMDDLATTVSDIRRVARSLREALADEEGSDSLKNIVGSIEQVVEGLNETVASLREEGPEIIERAERIARAIDEIVGENRQDVEEAIAQIKQSAKKLNQSLDSIADITKGIEEGRGTIGRLVKDEGLINRTEVVIREVEDLAEALDRIKVFLGYQGDYLISDVADDRGLKSRFSFRIQTKADKFYLFEIVDDPSYDTVSEVRHTRTDPNDPDVVLDDYTEREEKEGGLKFSLEMGRKFYGFTFRGGLIESSGGVGIDYDFLRDRVRLGFEAFDFGRDDDNPVLHTMIMFQLTRHIHLSGGVYDIISEHDQRKYFAGGGIVFLDEDLKTLLPFIPAP